MFWTGDEVIDGLRSNLLEKVMKAPVAMPQIKHWAGG